MPTTGKEKKEKIAANAATPANGAGFDVFFGWVLIRVLLDGWKRVTP